MKNLSFITSIILFFSFVIYTVITLQHFTETKLIITLFLLQSFLLFYYLGNSLYWKERYKLTREELDFYTKFLMKDSIKTRVKDMKF